MPELSTSSNSEQAVGVPPSFAYKDVFKHARGAVSSWVMPFNATLLFGTTLASIFDFLSPRIALLPIAAVLAVVGLASALALRKYVAPSLPAESAFRRALAPDMSLQKSPVLIVGVLMSALMVSGAAWSHANAAEGGIIASKFDSVRIAQMQTGILQGMQKEQRQQTAVLEDIREGRAADPRRELGNIGGGFSKSELDTAIDSSDVRMVRLLLAGGLKWRVSNAYVAFAGHDNKMSSLLLDNMTSFEMRNGDCQRLIEEKFNPMYQIPTLTVGEEVPVTNTPEVKSEAELQSFQRKILKTFCTKPEVQKFVKNKLLLEQQTQQKTAQSREVCVKNKVTQRKENLEMMKYHESKNSSACYSSDCSNSNDRLRLSANDESKYLKVAQEVCLEEFPINPKTVFGNSRNMVLMYQEILDSIS